VNADDTIVAPITSAHSKERFAIRISGSAVRQLRVDWLAPAESLGYQAIQEKLNLGFAEPIEVLSLTMPQGCSYTKEDVWEVHFEANETVLSRLLEKCYKAGVRPAEPGEFTRRAYLNGRLDLEQAQAIAALVQAKNQNHRSQALKMMAGHRGDLLRNLRLQLTSMRAHLEAVIDFPEEPDAYESRELWRKEWTELKNFMQVCRQQMSSQMSLESQLRVLVVGAANSGKSSFLKVMVPSAQPIISTHAGTTLDLVPYSMTLDQKSLLLYDSPGLKQDESLLDQLSLKQLREKVHSFDAFLLLENEDDDFMKVLSLPEDRPFLRLLAKADLNTLNPKKRQPWSAMTLEGEKDIRKTLKQWAVEHQSEEHSPWWSLRMQILSHGESTLERLHELLCGHEAQEELAAYEIDEWLDMWDGILAEEKDSDQLLDLVFREFCIGK
jgi:tRNA modification GTPase